MVNNRGDAPFCIHLKGDDVTSKIRQITYPPTLNGPRAGNSYTNTFIDEVVVSSGAVDAGKVPVTGANGQLDPSLVPTGSLVGDIDGGSPDSNYGGITSIDGGGV